MHRHAYGKRLVLDYYREHWGIVEMWIRSTMLRWGPDYWRR